MKLSVALCTYNGELFLKEQLDSILNQTLAVDEIIICDDKSTDTTIAIVKEYQEKYSEIISIYENETTLRSVKNFEKAISLCTGDMIFLSDQDDIWVNTKTEKYCEFFNQNPTIQVLASNGYCIDEKSVVSEKYSLWDISDFLREQGVKIDYFKTITYFSNIATGASMALRKEILPEILPFPVIKDLHHDEWIAIIASSKNAFEMLNEKYFYYRIHQHQQIGGVFFDKTEKQKRFLTKYYDISLKNGNFYFLKRKIKKLIYAYNKNHQFINEQEKHKELFKENGIQIKAAYHNTINQIKKKYPVRYFILRVIDKIQNKRQLKC
jgi:glycosyltransferase involved in cell wall biosynthesis